jgi:hypothetical protein
MSQLPTNMPKRMDYLMLFDRSDGSNPFLLCDAHGSRFEEPFLEYTIESNFQWNGCIGVPYGRSVWKVDDSVEQNITFKIESKKTNAHSVSAKIRAGLLAIHEIFDIVSIVNIAWQKSFTRVERNKKAIAAPGCGPRNYIFMDHPE